MEPGSAPSGVDTSKAHPARMYDYFLGGNDSYPADREAAEAMLRSHQQVSGFFEGFDLVEPGVQVPLWRPDHEPLPPGELAKVAIYGGVGRVR
jgi:hypothetical protein